MKKIVGSLTDLRALYVRTKPGASIEGIESTTMLECAAPSSQGVPLEQVECAGVEHIEC